jgi:hypothetical protein
MTDETTTLYVIYNNKPAPALDTELPVLLHRLTDGTFDSKPAIYGEHEVDDARQQLKERREDNGDHIKCAEVEVADWSLSVEELEQA